MGRNKWSSKQLVEDCEDIDIFWLKRRGLLCGYASSGIEWKYSSGRTNTVGITVQAYKNEPSDNYLRLIYTMTDNQSGDKTDYDYKVEIVTTPCNLGGERFWFICPLVTNYVPCRRRVAKLYLPSGGKYFGCRHCYNLTYRSVKEHDKRVDFLAKHPELLQAMVETGGLTNLGLALKVCTKKRW